MFTTIEQHSIATILWVARDLNLGKSIHLYLEHYPAMMKSLWNCEQAKVC